MEDRLNGWHTDKEGTRMHYREGYIHREDGPALIGTNGDQYWLSNGYIHREGGPAVIYPDGYQAWYLNDKRHREDGPAVIWPNGHQEWFLNGEEVCKRKVLDTPEKREAYLLEESIRRL